MNPWLGIAGLLVLIYGIVAWVRAAGNEWEEVEESPTTTRRGTDRDHERCHRRRAAARPRRCAGAWSGRSCPSSCSPPGPGRCWSVGRPATAGLQIGQPAPDFALTDLDGNALQLSDLRGDR